MISEVEKFGKFEDFVIFYDEYDEYSKTDILKKPSLATIPLSLAKNFDSWISLKYLNENEGRTNQLIIFTNAKFHDHDKII